MSAPLKTLNTAAREDFTRRLGGVFESSPWVAAGAWERRPFTTVDELHAAMVEVVREAGSDRQLALIRAHPDLAGRAALAGELTESSKREQAGAGLDRLSQGEYARFQGLNEAYQERFGFPFVSAVKGHSKESILAAFEERLMNDAEAERARALLEIAKIARFRLMALTGE
ncbi:MAG: 2-oxo-4-hydroxy-4-carboxy-5-ureidoimidazoline decarboxylase [Deinococcota bacterium]|nr:2-oxo-4-hydroxy-4-carboxy-5-ureidoimidazoline decarboxylase [Deinococcota bacterium]